MFTETDYRMYFTAIRDADRKMAERLNRMIPNISEPEIVNELTHIRNQELSHLKLEEELFAILDKVPVGQK
jgi:hypothetical protein